MSSDPRLISELNEALLVMAGDMTQCASYVYED